MIKIIEDIELNSGSKQKQDQILSICYWNLNSIPAHNFLKLELFHGYISNNKVDILCLSETFLNSDTHVFFIRNPFKKLEAGAP